MRNLGFLALLFLVVPACHGGDGAPPATATTTAVRTSENGVQRGPISLPFDPTGDGDPCSLAWDDATSTLFVADNQHDRIWRWDDKAGFAKLTTLPSDPGAPDRNNVGQIVHLADGTFVVPRFGFGEHGGIAFTNANGKSGTVPGLVADRRRIALTSANGALFGAYFLHPKGQSPIGTVTKVTLAGETDYATGFKKPVAVLFHDGKIIVSDQGANTLYAIPLEGAKEPYAVFAKVPNPDTLTEGPDGSLITGQYRQTKDGEAVSLRRVFPDGRVEIIESSLELTKPQGVAYDRTNRRVFVADSNAKDVRTVKILPVD